MKAEQMKKWDFLMNDHFLLEPPYEKYQMVRKCQTSNFDFDTPCSTKGI